MLMQRGVPNPRLFLALVLFPAAGCATGALGSLFSIGSIFSLVPGSQGPPGMNGTNGADGSLRIYGDGSLGDKTFSQSEDLVNFLQNNSAQFRNLTIDPGVTLTIPSGAVVRCSESFVNNGTIQVETSASDFLFGSSGPGSGVSREPASNGEFGDDSENRNGGAGGVALASGEAKFLLDADPRGGGAGGGVPGFGERGGAGGGRLIILARTALTNNGLIQADGAG